MKLTSDIIVELGLKRARIAALIREEKRLADLIKDRMIEKNIDEFRPRDSINKLVLNEYYRTEVDYEDMSRKAYQTLYGTAWQMRWENVKASYGKRRIATILIQPNENFNSGKYPFTTLMAPKKTRKIRLGD